MEYTAQTLFTLLNTQDESDWIEAKAGSESARAMMETVSLSASRDLGNLRNLALIMQKGQKRGAYYVAGEGLSTQAQSVSTQAQLVTTQASIDIPSELQGRIKKLKKRVGDSSILEKLILELCAIQPLDSNSIADILQRNENYLRREFLGRMIKEGKLVYTHPEMVNHPHQAYQTVNT